MFSLQTIFGKGDQFHALFNEAADAAHESTKALHAMWRDPARVPTLEPQACAPARTVGLRRISQALVDRDRS